MNAGEVFPYGDAVLGRMTYERLPRSEARNRPILAGAVCSDPFSDGPASTTEGIGLTLVDPTPSEPSSLHGADGVHVIQGSARTCSALRTQLAPDRLEVARFGLNSLKRGSFRPDRCSQSFSVLKPVYRRASDGCGEPKALSRTRCSSK